MIYRSEYIENVRPFIGKPLIKVITGIRRSGKSAILSMIQQEIKRLGIKDDRITYLNFESIRWDKIKNATALYSYLDSVIKKDAKHYLFLDEIQEVEDWEKVINSLTVDFDTDIYITGSNSRLLSSELSTYLSGRYIEFKVYPLSFAEFLLFHGIDSADRNVLYSKFEQYVRQGGFPVVHIADYEDSDIYRIVEDIYSSTLLRDTIQRFNIRNIDLLERIVAFIFKNTGNITNPKNIADYFKSQQRKFDTETIYSYLKALEASYLVHRVSRYDLQGKAVLQTNEKYYVADPSLIYSKYGYTPDLSGGIMEQIVFTELCRRKYKVYVGKTGDKEIDFVAENADKRIYVQVCLRFDNDNTLERELSPLQSMHDGYPKYILTTDTLHTGDYNGIKCMHIADFLLNR